MAEGQRVRQRTLDRDVRLRHDQRRVGYALRQHGQRLPGHAHLPGRRSARSALGGGLRLLLRAGARHRSRARPDRPARCASGTDRARRIDGIPGGGGRGARVLPAGPRDPDPGGFREPVLRTGPRGRARACHRPHPPSARRRGDPHRAVEPRVRGGPGRGQYPLRRGARDRRSRGRLPLLRQGDRTAARLRGDLHVQAVRGPARQRIPHPPLTVGQRRQRVRGPAGPTLVDRQALPRRHAGADGGSGPGRGHHAQRLPAPAALHLLPDQHFLGVRQPHRRPAGHRRVAGCGAGGEARWLRGLQPLLPDGLRAGGRPRRNRARAGAAPFLGRQRLRVRGGAAPAHRSRHRPSACAGVGVHAAGPRG